MEPIPPSIGTVPPLPAHTLLLFLLQTGVLLGLALVLGRLARRARLPGVVGELTAGVLLGPTVLAALAPGLSARLFPPDPVQMHLLDAVGQLGVLLLVGFTGMHLDLTLARRNAKATAAVSAAALLFPLALGYALGRVLPAGLRPPGADPTLFAAFLGVALCVSSIPVIARVLGDMDLLHRPAGQMILVVATVDDAVGWLLVSIVTALAITGPGPGEIATPLVHLAILILAALTAGRWTVRWVMRWAARAGTGAPAVTAVVVLVVLASAGAQALGFEAVLGAFLCGVLIRTTSSEPVVQARRLEPLDTTVLAFLAPLFFALAGLRIDLTALARPTTVLWAGAALAVAVAGKFLGAFTGGALAGLGRWESLAVGAGINARGVVQIVVAVVGVRAGLLTTELYSIIVLIAITTPLMAPPILKAAMKRIPPGAWEQTAPRPGCARSGRTAVMPPHTG
ncbi:cation:proton antiporter [Streptomyces yaizuensis]|uniref:Cation:proton antiporter n=1 Tax=Streptomyces yaizuensis TaxID=2989713 RepID=A0ABQ5P690_9ACTN|nr:cation:proton antiporter [Streptomyces sp. YSPA8]GLF98100.1 cation:proton antiporter [Streptomyces sp. YSPA8]